MSQQSIRRAAASAFASAAIVVVTTIFPTVPQASAADTLPSSELTQAEIDELGTADVATEFRTARALTVREGAPPTEIEARIADRAPDGAEEAYEGTLGSGDSNLARSGALLWPGAAAANPNLQIGRLMFDVDPGPRRDMKHCSATVVNTPNKSMVITAGHCVYNPDPDGNGIVSGNGYWYKSFSFCPGYQYGCTLGNWNYRRVATTRNWYYGFGASHRYDMRDDVAILIMRPSPTRGKIANYVGAQGIKFNAKTGLTRHAFGYPVTDSRWPQYTYSGEDLYYAKGTDYWDRSVAGTVAMANKMTGGSSGGPWLIQPNANWGGYINSVNSHKMHGADSMNGPYFNNAERDLYNAFKD